MKKIVIETDQAPAAIGPYSQALAAGPFVFISGQIPLDPNGRLVEGDIVVQTVQVIANLKAILAAVGLGLKDVVKTTVYLTDLADFQEMNRTYGEFFPQHPPARTTIQVAVGVHRDLSGDEHERAGGQGLGIGADGGWGLVGLNDNLLHGRCSLLS